MNLRGHTKTPAGEIEQHCSQCNRTTLHQRFVVRSEGLTFVDVWEEVSCDHCGFTRAFNRYRTEKGQQ